MTGRPTDYRPEYCEQVEKLCRLGATDKEIADFFGKAESTINLWKLEHPDFSESIKKGKIDADAKVASSLYHRALGYKHAAVQIFNDGGTPLVVDYIKHYAPDTTAAIFWLKNRRKEQWRDRHEVETTQNVNVTVTHVKDSLSRKLDRVAATLETPGMAGLPIAGRA